jgi:hypothetical protein
MIGKIGKLGKGLFNAGKTAIEFGQKMLVSGAQAAEAGAEAILPWLPFIAAAAAVGLVAYEIYKHWSTVKAALAAVWNGIKTAALAVFNAIKTAVVDAVDWVVGLPAKIMRAVENAGTWLFSAGVNVIKGLVLGFFSMEKWIATQELHIAEWVVRGIGDVTLWLFDKGKDVLRGLWNGLWWVWTQEIKGLLKIKDWILDALKVYGEAAKWLYDIGKQILEGMWHGITDAAKDVGKGASAVKDAVVGAIKGVFGIGSPSKVMMEQGAFLMQGLAQGISGNAHLPAGAMADLGGLRVPTMTLPAVRGPIGAPAVPGAQTATTGPQTIHYHYKIDKPTIQAANLDDLTKTMQREAARANFSGEGSGVDW